MKSRKAVNRDVNLFALIAEIKPMMLEDPFMKNLTGYTRKHHVDILIDILRKADWSQPDEQIAYSIIDKQQKYRKELTARRNAKDSSADEGVLLNEPKQIVLKPKFEIGERAFIVPEGYFDIKVEYICGINIQSNVGYGFGQETFFTYNLDNVPEYRIMTRTEFLEKLYKMIEDVKAADMSPMIGWR